VKKLPFVPPAGLERRFLLMAALVLAVVFSLFVYLASTAVENSSRLVFRERLALAQRIAADIDYAVTYSVREVEKMASLASPGLGRGEAPQQLKACLPMCHARAQIDILLVAVADTKGQLQSLAPQDFPQKIPPQVHLSIEEALARGRTTVLEGGSDRRGPAISVATPLRDGGGQVECALLLHFDPLRGLPSLLPAPPAQGTRYNLEVINREGVVLAGEGAEEGRVSQHLVTIAPFRERWQAGMGKHENPEDSPAHMVAFAPLSSLPWGVVLELEPDTAVMLPEALRRRSLLLGGMALVFSLALAWWASRRVAEPVRALIRTTDSIGAGELEQPVPVRGMDEIGLLARAFDTMRARLKASREEMERLDRLKTEFIVRASHELRTPLTSLKASAETLLRPDLRLRPSTRRELLGNIDRAADRLSRITNDLVAVSRLESGKLEVHGQTLALPPLIEQVLREFRSLAPGRALISHLSPDLPTVRADPDRLQDVLINLLSNAVKYSPEDKPVIVEARRGKDSTVVISVTDEGTGIPAPEMGKLFQRFSRVESTSRSIGGLGLGLYICRSYVEAMGGKIWVESTPGKGSTFSFTLPTPTDTGKDP